MKRLTFKNSLTRVAARLAETVLFLSLVTPCFAGDIRINARPGEIYKLPSSLNDTHIYITGGGAAGAPFVLAGAVGKTVMNGNSFILITGDYITVQNLSFINNNIAYRDNEALVQMGTKKNSANNVIIRNCDFDYPDAFNDRDIATQFYWIEFFGRNDLVDYCTFQGKQNRLPVIHVNSRTWQGDDNEISNCTFQNVKPRKGEALEAIRVGFGNSRSNCKIVNNKFINYSGDSETISCKSNGVIITGNTFIGCRSGVSLRLSDSSQISNNKFTNSREPIRVSGVGHSITNNIFDSGQTSLIFMKAGGGCSYKQASDINVSDNIFVGEFAVKFIETKDCGIMPTQFLKMRHNFVYNNTLLAIKEGDFDSALQGTNPAVKIRTDGIKEVRYGMQNTSPAAEVKMLKRITDYKSLKLNN
jgi:poly(beta-D-mannuronate) lyase